MTLAATEYPLISAEATESLEQNGYTIFVSTEHTLEAGNGDKVLQVIRLEDGEYRLAKIPQHESSSIRKVSMIVPEMGEVLKWLEAEGETDS